MDKEIPHFLSSLKGWFGGIVPEWKEAPVVIFSIKHLFLVFLSSLPHFSIPSLMFPEIASLTNYLHLSLCLMVNLEGLGVGTG